MSKFLFGFFLIANLCGCVEMGATSGGVESCNGDDCSDQQDNASTTTTTTTS